MLECDLGPLRAVVRKLGASRTGPNPPALKDSPGSQILWVLLPLV